MAIFIYIYLTKDYSMKLRTFFLAAFAILAAACEVTVPVSSVTVVPFSVEIEVGEVRALSAVIAPDNATNPQVIWETSDSEVVTVSDDGHIKGIAPGEATVKAVSVDGGRTGSCNVTVKGKDVPPPPGPTEVNVSGIKLDITTAGLKIDESVTLTATVEPADATNKNVSWSIDPVIATLSPDGLKCKVTASKYGAATVTVTTEDGGKTATCAIEVTQTVIRVTKVTLSESSLNMVVDDTATLTATVEPEDATNQTVTWSSSDESIAKVEDGKVTAIAPGTAEITATADEVSAKCAVTVSAKEIPVTEVGLDIVEKAIKMDETVTLSARIKPEDATNKNVSWKVEPDIATLAPDGLKCVVTPKDYGTATVTVTTEDGGKTASAIIHIEKTIIAVTAVKLSASSLEMEEGDTETLTAVIEPDDATDTAVNWTSTDEKVATVKDGVVTAVAEGKAEIKATAGDVTAVCKVTVSKKVIPVTAIKLSAKSLDMVEGDTETLTATIEPENATDKTVTWTSTDEKVATVKDGVVTAVAEGSAEIRAAAGDLIAACKVTVSKKVIAVTGIKLSSSNLNMVVGDFVTLTAEVEPADATDKTVTWSSSKESVAYVKDGVVKAMSAGTAEIKATAGSFSAVCKVNVTEKTVEVTGIKISKSSMEMVEGDTATLTAEVEPSNATDKTVTWSSTDDKVASVKDGVVTAVAPGKADIKATAGGYSAVCSVTVTKKTIAVTGVKISKSSLELTEGDTATLTAEVEPSNATDKTVTWSSSDDKVASVKDGVVTAVAPGEADIKATAGGFSATCKVTVNKKIVHVKSVELSQSELALKKGDVYTLIATVLPEDATDKTVSWSSSAPTVVSVENGVLTALKTGTAIITVVTNDGNRKDTCEVTVKEEDIELVSIKFDLEDKDLLLARGTTYFVPVVFEPSNATDKTLEWTSSDDEVASVEDGVITAVGAGTATIKATASNGCSDELTVKVFVAAKSLTIDPAEVELQQGEKWNLEAKILPEDATETDVEWKSLNPSVATVTNDGMVTGVAVGIATIEASVGSVKATAKVTVKEKYIAVNTLIIGLATLNLPLGQTYQMTCTISPSNATDQTIVWSSSNESVATVSSDGLVTPVAKGKTVIKAACGGKEATCTVYVTDPVLLSISIPEELDVKLNETKTLKAVLEPADASNPGLVWEIDNPSIATINGESSATTSSHSPSVQIKGKAMGEATITVYSTTDPEDIKATCKVTVGPVPIETLEIVDYAGKTVNLQIGKSMEIKFKYSPADANPVSYHWGTNWDGISSGKGSVSFSAGSDAQSVKVTGKTVGDVNVVITADYTEAKSSVRIHVTP